MSAASPTAVAESRAIRRPVRIVYAMTGAERVGGGIARNNKNVLQAVGKVIAQGRGTLTVLSLHESSDDRPPYLEPEDVFLGFRGNKLRFSLRLLQHSLGGGMVIADHVTLSLPLLPLVLTGRCQLVVLAHGSEADDRMKASSRWMFRAATKVLTNSNLTLNRLLHRLPEVRGEACELGLSPDFSLSDRIPPPPTGPLELVACDGKSRPIGPQALLLVGRIDSSEGEKGHAAVIEALAHVRRRFPRAQGIFPGDGSGRAGLMELAEKHQVADAVFFPGYVSTEALKQLYGRSFAFVMPSQQEGFGLVYLEAMSYGLPCIGCRNDGAEEVIVPEETGLLIDGAVKIKELVAAIERLLEQPAWSRQLGENGFARLHAKFTSAAYQQRFVEALTALMPQ